MTILSGSEAVIIGKDGLCVVSPAIWATIMPEAARCLGALGPDVGRRKVTPGSIANGDLSEAVLACLAGAAHAHAKSVGWINKVDVGMVPEDPALDCELYMSDSISGPRLPTDKVTAARAE